MGHPPRVSVWLGLDQDVVYFITFCVQRRLPVLANDEAFFAFNSAIAQSGWHILAAVVMPDHIHLLGGPPNRDAAVGSLSAGIKRAMRRKLQAQWEWQPGSFDRLLRREESVGEKWEYIRENPVRACLVQHWSDWSDRPGLVGQAFLPAAAKPAAKRERLPYKHSRADSLSSPRFPQPGSAILSHLWKRRKKFPPPPRRKLNPPAEFRGSFSVSR